MYFLTNETWQVKDPILRSFHHDQDRLYPCVEVELNKPLWHLDLKTNFGDEVECWRRFIFTSVEQLIVILATHDGEQRLHVQTPLRLGHAAQSEYEIWPVKALLGGSDKAGHSVYVVTLSSRRFIYPDSGVREDELLNLQTLYKCKRCPSTLDQT